MKNERYYRRKAGVNKQAGLQIFSKKAQASRDLYLDRMHRWYNRVPVRAAGRDLQDKRQGLHRVLRHKQLDQLL